MSVLEWKEEKSFSCILEILRNTKKYNELQWNRMTIETCFLQKKKENIFTKNDSIQNSILPKSHVAF